MRSPAWAPGEDISGKDDKDRKDTKDLKDKKKERPAPLSSLSLVSLVSLSSLPGPDVAHDQEGDVGNQDNQVKIQPFPASQLLGYRWPQA